MCWELGSYKDNRSNNALTAPWTNQAQNLPYNVYVAKWYLVDKSEMNSIPVGSNGSLHPQRTESSVQFQDQELGAFPIIGTSHIQHNP